MIARCLLASGLLIGTLAIAHGKELTATVNSPNSTVATRDVIYFHSAYPVFLRLHIQVDNASFDAMWLKYVESVFRQIDTDDDGRLSRDETHSKAVDLSSEGASIVRARNLWTAELVGVPRFWNRKKTSSCSTSKKVLVAFFGP